MMWNATMLAIHLIGLWACGVLYRLAPCWMQKGVIGIIALAMFALATSNGFAIFGEEFARYYLAQLGLALEHLGVLLYVFRLLYQAPWVTSSRPSHNSPR